MTPLAAFAVPLPEGVEDAVGILRFMESVREERQVEPFVREFAVRLLGAAGVGDHDQEAQARALTDFVRLRMRYVLDPVGSEYVVDPVTLLNRILRDGLAHGDCDDHALLLATLLGSVGIEARLAGVKLDSDIWDHVITQAHVGGQWMDLDACAKSGAQHDYAEKLTVDAEGAAHTELDKEKPRRSGEGMNGFGPALIQPVSAFSFGEGTAVGSQFGPYGTAAGALYDIGTAFADFFGGGTDPLQDPTRDLARDLDKLWAAYAQLLQQQGKPVPARREASQCAGQGWSCFNQWYKTEIVRVQGLVLQLLNECQQGSQEEIAVCQQQATQLGIKTTAQSKRQDAMTPLLIAGGVALAVVLLARK